MLSQILQNINNTLSLVNCVVGFLILFIGLMALAAYAKHFYPLGLPIGLGALPKSETADAEQTHKAKIHLVA